jgi:DNA-binding YbaB/EbfC family protein
LNMDKIMKQAQKMQAQMAKVQEELAGEKVEGSAGGGMVTVTANGQGDVVGVRIDPEVMKGDDVEMLEDLVLAAVNEALRRSKELAAERMGRITGGLGSMGLF